MTGRRLVVLTGRLVVIGLMAFFFFPLGMVLVVGGACAAGSLLILTGVAPLLGFSLDALQPALASMAPVVDPGMNWWKFIQPWDPFLVIPIVILYLVFKASKTRVKKLGSS